MNKNINWSGIEFDIDDKAIILEVCNELYGRIANNDTIGKSNDLTLANGISGILLYLCELYIVTGIDTREVIYKYLKKSQHVINHYINDYSLYTGITGLNYVVNLIHKATGDYSFLLKQLDSLYIKNYKAYLLDQKGGKNNCSDYDIISGNAGVIRYALSRYEDNDNMLSILYDQMNCICDVYERKWAKLISFNATLDVENVVDLGMAHGISGIISILALIKSKQLADERSTEILNDLMNWVCFLKESEIKDSLWPSKINVQNGRVEIMNSKYRRAAWCYGSPGVATSLYMAGVAMNSAKIRQEANNIMKDVYNSSMNSWLITSPMICHGFSGILNIVYRLQEFEFKNDISHRIIKRILKMVDYDKEFCFLNIDMNKVNDSAGFLMGSCGIALTLLSSISETEPTWDQVLLIS